MELYWESLSFASCHRGGCRFARTEQDQVQLNQVIEHLILVQNLHVEVRLNAEREGADAPASLEIGLSPLEGLDRILLQL